jgi:subtilase family serine protease
MIRKGVCLLLCSVSILLLIIPKVSAPGTHNVDIYENEREVIFEEGEGLQTIEMKGAVNFTGICASPYIVELSSSFELGSSTISPVTMTFHTTGSEEFTVTLRISNEHENGTTGVLEVQGAGQQGGTILVTADYADIIIINHSQAINDSYNPDNSEGNQGESTPSGIGGILIVSSIIIIAVVGFMIYKKTKK